MTGEDLVIWLESLQRYLQQHRKDFFPHASLLMMQTTKKYAIMQAWPEDEVPIYLCSFHVLKIWKNHICTKIPNLGALRDLIYRKLHFFMYVNYH
jgi:hypothetical protein